MLELIGDVKNFQDTPIQKVWDNDGDQILAYTVSYTHLDVYKRQPKSGAGREGLLAGETDRYGAILGDLPPDLRQERRGEGGLRAAMRPVSYTHLDVYKRQA